MTQSGYNLNNMPGFLNSLLNVNTKLYVKLLMESFFLTYGKSCLLSKNMFILKKNLNSQYQGS